MTYPSWYNVVFVIGRPACVRVSRQWSIDHWPLGRWVIPANGPQKSTGGGQKPTSCRQKSTDGSQLPIITGLAAGRSLFLSAEMSVNPSVSVQSADLSVKSGIVGHSTGLSARSTGLSVKPADMSVEWSGVSVLFHLSINFRNCCVCLFTSGEVLCAPLLPVNVCPYFNQ